MECPYLLSFEFYAEDISGRHHFQSVQGVPSAPGPGLGWVDFDLVVQPSCPATQTPLSYSHQPRQNFADSGTLKIQVNPVHELMGHHVYHV